MYEYGNNTAISIHALREEGDAVRTACARLFCRFLSTPSARRATVTSPDSRLQIPISIHALREEGDMTWEAHAPRRKAFLSTPSARRATNLGKCNKPIVVIFLSTPSARRATYDLQ